VLDLDYTLLNSARWGEIDQQYAIKLEDHLEREEQGLPPAQRNLHSLEAIQMWTKLRPNCREFLQALSDKYIMWIHTNGNRYDPIYPPPPPTHTHTHSTPTPS